jgi:chromosome segregation ATPase
MTGWHEAEHPRAEPVGEAYDRGHVDGGIAARLAEHDKHFVKINGSVERSADELHALNGRVQALRLDVQRVADQNEARDARVIATAAALKEADDARRTKTETVWSPIAKVYATIVTLVAIVSLYLALTRKA